MNTLLIRASYSLRPPSCSSRYAVVYGKQLTTWTDRLRRWRSSPQSENDSTNTAEAANTEADAIATTKDGNSDNGLDDNPLSQLVKEKDEVITKQRAELEELNVHMNHNRVDINTLIQRT